MLLRLRMAGLLIPFFWMGLPWSFYSSARAQEVSPRSGADMPNQGTTAEHVNTKDSEKIEDITEPGNGETVESARQIKNDSDGDANHAASKSDQDRELKRRWLKERGAQFSHYWDGGQPYKYIGNSSSNKFHWRTCPFGRAESTSHVVLFAYRKQAVDAGFVPCRYCLPQQWTSVQAKILPKAKLPAGIERAAQPPQAHPP